MFNPGVSDRNSQCASESMFFSILACVALMQARPVSIPEWHYHVHPSGQPYYECTRSDSRFRYLTEADVTKTSILEEIFYFTVEFEQEADSYPEISSDVEVVIDINGDAWQYYMADLNHRRIFWIHGYEMTLTDFGIERLEQLST